MMVSDAMKKHMQEHVSWPANAQDIWEACDNLKGHVDSDMSQAEVDEMENMIKAMPEHERMKKYDSVDGMVRAIEGAM